MTSPRTVALVTLGCARNEVDSEELAARLTAGGWDLVDDPELRRGLVTLWQAEADDAGLDIDALHALEDCAGRCNQQERWCLAELQAGGARYVLRAEQVVGAAFAVRVHADPAE